MTTRIPDVTVAPAGPDGFTIRCNRCPGFLPIRPVRWQADALAIDHRRRHATPDPADHIDELASWTP